jgi:hypothetical protein
MESKVLEGLKLYDPGNKCLSILSHSISHYLQIQIRPRITLAIRSHTESHSRPVGSSEDKFSEHGSIAKPLDEV